ncbi:type 4a pilus biogenesis protein PilO [Candidatus Roizmanbacteria bacterium]|nr:type 4a pilus biogenesis protein PilO [Candidatus Roizmanbacteria bacterium]
MKETEILKKILSKKTTDYTFTVVFFFIFSFFVFFVIRPTLVTVFVLQKEVHELKELDKEYEKAIFSIVSVQSKLENNRSLFPMLSYAIPATPQVNKVVDDIRKVASASSIDIKRIEVNEINLKEIKEKDNVKPYIVSLETTSDFNTVNKFMAEIVGQRRLKTIKGISITKENKESTESSQLKIQLEVEAYYL